MNQEMKTQNKASQPPHYDFSTEQALAEAQRVMAVGQLQHAEQICLMILQAVPEHAGALHTLGIIAQRVGKLAVAIELVQRALMNDADNGVMYSNLCEMIRQTRHPELAEPHGKRAIALAPKNPAALNNYAIVLQELERYEEALPFFNRALKIAPDYAECHSNLGNTYKKMRRNEEALAAYRKALSINPRYAEAMSNMAVVMNTIGDHQQALKLAEQAVTLNPYYAEGFNNLAIALESLEQHERAIAAAERSIAIRPDYAEAYATLAGSLKEVGRLNAALITAEKALELKRNGEVLAVYGLILHHLGREEEAEKAYREAVELAPDSADARNGWAHALTEMRRNDEALEQFRKAVGLDPQLAPCYMFNLAYAKKFKEGDSDLPHMETMLAHLNQQSPRYAEHAAQLNYALGKAHQDLGDYERAWSYFAAGAAIKRSTIDSSSLAAHEQLFERVMTIFTAEQISKLEGLGDPSLQPIFIIGMPRSGTSLVEQILASHPDVFGAGELPDANLTASTVMGSDNCNIPYPEYIGALDEKSLKQMGAAYLQRINARIPQSQRFTDKMPANFFFLGLLHLMLPNAKIIHCKRNPLDNCVSLFTTLFTAHQDFSYELGELGHFYNRYEKLMKHWCEVLPQGSFLDVQYEDTVDHLEAQARRIIDFCGLPWNDTCLDFHKTQRAVRTASIQQVRQPIYKSSVERWRRYESYLAPLQTALKSQKQ